MVESKNAGGKAITFISFSQKNGFAISPEARALLLSLGNEPVGVLAVAGKYRTGKSLLLNRILLQTQGDTGFGVGPTINPCTKGLWMWD